MVLYTLALLRSALGRLLHPWYLMYQRYPGAVDQADDIPALWQVIVGLPSNLGDLLHPG